MDETIAERYKALPESWKSGKGVRIIPGGITHDSRRRFPSRSTWRGQVGQWDVDGRGTSTAGWAMGRSSSGTPTPPWSRR
jgi:hypothetical protein